MGAELNANKTSPSEPLAAVVHAATGSSAPNNLSPAGAQAMAGAAPGTADPPGSSNAVPSTHNPSAGGASAEAKP